MVGIGMRYNGGMTASHPINLHYTVSGYGPDVLLIHGLMSSSAMWQRLRQHLEHQYRFWAVDLYGFGESPRPDPAESLDINRHLELLLEFCARQHLRPHGIIGHSMGGLLTLKLALAQPDLTQRLALLAPVVTGRYTLDLHHLALSSLGKTTVALTKPLWPLTQQVLGPLFTRPTHWYVEAATSERIVRELQQASWEASTAAILSIPEHNLETDLPRIQQPTLVVVGSADPTVPPEQGRLAARLIPQAQLLDLPGVHHQPLDERPQVVIAALSQHLAPA
jgi:pimeloyl-ACP methyl ester carboxylesterase